jgi:hypothetical protein
MNTATEALSHLATTIGMTMSPSGLGIAELRTVDYGPRLMAYIRNDGDNRHSIMVTVNVPASEREAARMAELMAHLQYLSHLQLLAFALVGGKSWSSP